MTYVEAKKPNTQLLPHISNPLSKLLTARQQEADVEVYKCACVLLGSGGWTEQHHEMMEVCFLFFYFGLEGNLIPRSPVS